MPPVQSGATKYCAVRIAREAYMMMEEPLGAKPYLCVSVDMEVTPGTTKSKAGSACPAAPAQAMRKEPRQASTCRGRPRRSASAPSSPMGSTTPCG